ncbi:Mannan endo-1,6-alpha-mannosidase [Metarhizium album ARSEF 1941]|uniref:Mannan endo-1,6-alpha-mannosidase n=1 Tax=Metarhizium album (strain ARSEF 1941) TaxID=1081103 RepID=A0A0B2WRJ7_METAS|nr:Mannan endo-1,6-alpha-mannosidase [Metarhizium album ARSEF 1941]KHN96643.1 Mannan endo-1,6-alpha-mannosidase [Metarhizium album ARSEF 1941]
MKLSSCPFLMLLVAGPGRRGGAAAASVFSLDSDDAVKKSASVLAWDMLQYYHGNESGATPGILPGPPPGGDYYWWEAGAMWGTLIHYWALTGDETYNGEIMKAMQSQVGEGQDYMPRNVTVSLGNDDQAFWGMAAMLAAESKFPDPPADRPGWLGLAQAVFNTQASPQRHDGTCGGGLRWQIPFTNNGYGYKNSEFLPRCRAAELRRAPTPDHGAGISSGCFFNMAARLSRYTGDARYSDWAEKTWDWVEQVGFIDPGNYAVYDGANVAADCKDINEVQYSYNNAIFAEGAAFMYNVTKGEQRWRDRVDKLIDYGLKTFFPDDVAVEISCEPHDSCKTDMFAYKGFMHRWYASATQIAPFTAGRVLPVLRKSAQAAVAQCTGGADGRQCGLNWADGRYVGETGAGQEMSVLAAVQSLLVGSARPPVTHDSGGTSAGSPNGGKGDESPVPGQKAVTAGDRVGASLVTISLLAGACGMFGWMGYEASGP